MTKRLLQTLKNNEDIVIQGFSIKFQPAKIVMQLKTNKIPTKYMENLSRLMNIRVVVNVKMLATNDIDIIVHQRQGRYFLRER